MLFNRVNGKCQFKVIMALLAMLGMAATVAQCAPITLTYQVTASADDGYAWEDTGQKLDWTILVGHSSSYTVPYRMGGLRFTGVEIPQGSIITEANLWLRTNKFNIYGDKEVYGVIQAEASDNPPNFNVSMMTVRSKGSAAVNWDHIGTYTPETWYTSPNISAVIQEVVNRTNWTAGNALVILYSTRKNDGNNQHFTSYDESVSTGDGYANAAKLEITYQGPVLKISGHVQTAGDVGVEEVLVSSDNGGGTDTTDSDGYYDIEVPDGWIGQVTVSKSGWRFEPESRSYNDLTADQGNQDYDGFLLPVISGHVRTDEGVGVEDVQVEADNEGESYITGSDGYYELILPNEWSGTVTPAKDGWGFAPEERSYNNLTGDQTDQDYTAFLLFAISGYVRTATGVGCKGVLVSADNGGGSSTTDNNGYYELMVPDGCSGTVTPSRGDWEFSPANQSHSDVSEDQYDEDYTILRVILTTQNYQVSASADDVYAWRPGQQNTTSTILYVGYDYITQMYPPPYQMAGMRFRDMEIAKEAIIVSAYLKMRNSIFVPLPGWPVYGVIHAEDADDPADFTSVKVDARTKTSASINWDHMETAGSEWWYTSPDITSVLQEVVNRPGWTTGNALVVIYSTRSEGYDRWFWSYDQSADSAPKLEVTYAETLLLGDFEPDGDVDLVDFAIMSLAWLSDDTPTPNWNEVCDLDGSGVIDIGDMVKLAEGWMVGVQP